MGMFGFRLQAVSTVCVGILAFCEKPGYLLVFYPSLHRFPLMVLYVAHYRLHSYSYTDIGDSKHAVLSV